MAWKRPWWRLGHRVDRRSCRQRHSMPGVEDSPGLEARNRSQKRLVPTPVGASAGSSEARLGRVRAVGPRPCGGARAPARRQSVEPGKIPGTGWPWPGAGPAGCLPSLSTQECGSCRHLVLRSRGAPRRCSWGERQCGEMEHRPWWCPSQPHILLGPSASDGSPG